MSNSDKPKKNQAFSRTRGRAGARSGRRISTISPGMEIMPPPSADEIAWYMILLGIDCGLDGPDIARWLVAMEGFPMWPPRDYLARLMRDAGL